MKRYFLLLFSSLNLFILRIVSLTKHISCFQKKAVISSVPVNTADTTEDLTPKVEDIRRKRQRRGAISAEQVYLYHRYIFV